MTLAELIPGRDRTAAQPKRGSPLRGMLLSAGMALAALGCGGSPSEEGGSPGQLAEGSAGVATQALASDPSSVATHGYCYNNYVWNGTSARVYYPANGGCAASVYSPLVVLLPGTGYSHTEYHDLLSHLAKNGFIAVSLDVLAASTSPADHQAAANEAWAFVDGFLWPSWSKRNYIDPTSVALIGHSRGGATVRYLAAKLANDPLFDVHAVVSLAPTGGDSGFVTGLGTIGYLSLYGTRDGDVDPSGVYRQYDNAGDEGSQFDPTWNGEVLYKAMKLIGGATHDGFTDGITFHENQRALTRGYVMSFLKAHNSNDVTWYEDYIRGNAVPNGWAGTIVSQYSDGFYRRVIDHFEDGTVGMSTIGDGVTLGGTLYTEVLNLAASPSLYANKTRALRVRATVEASYAQWAIPSGKRDASPFKWLSLRLGQASGVAGDDLRIQLRNGGVWSPELRVADHGAIAQPTTICLGLGCSADNTPTLSHMGTIRVPLASFGAHNDVDAVRFVFRGDSLSKNFILDNLEFSEWVLKP